MKKVIFGLALTATFAVFAEDSYLYWMVGDDVTMTYDTVKVAAVDSSWGVNYLTLATENFDELGETVSKGQITTANTWDMGFLASLGSFYDPAYTYFVELWNGDTVVGHTTDGITYADAQNYIVSKNAMDSKAESSWSTPGSGFSAGAIPEPTSGVMLLLGVAALALRRRRA